MGKYNNTDNFSELLKRDRNIEVEKWAILVTIANELAEANRLKRIEIRLNMNFDKFHDKELSKELEDNA
ncbi:MAG TPA: hypothetical protein VLE21_04760 [Candidatus Nitrosocosmicus sp.]|nr:hypothetical protein [Candidatus Nitrosocosmicus sp.]